MLPIIVILRAEYDVELKFFKIAPSGSLLRPPVRSFCSQKIFYTAECPYELGTKKAGEIRGISSAFFVSKVKTLCLKIFRIK